MVSTLCFLTCRVLLFFIFAKFQGWRIQIKWTIDIASMKHMSNYNLAFLCFGVYRLQDDKLWPDKIEHGSFNYLFLKTYTLWGIADTPKFSCCFLICFISGRLIFCFYLNAMLSLFIWPRISFYCIFSKI